MLRTAYAMPTRWPVSQVQQQVLRDPSAMFVTRFRTRHERATHTLAPFVTTEHYHPYLHSGGEDSSSRFVAMRILCLHGGGLNAKVMEMQMSGIIEALDPSYEFVFIDGEIERGPSPGVPAGTPGPFFSYHEGLEADGVRAACDLIDIVLEEEGPFDGFVGFSQGAAVGISFLLDSEIHQPDKECPFKWILLFSSTIALSADANLYDFEFELRDMLRKQEEMDKDKTVGADAHERKAAFKQQTNLIRSAKSRELFLEDSAFRDALSEDYRDLSKAYAVTAENEGKTGVLARYQDDMDSEQSANAPKFYHPGMTIERVPVPSIHCVGKNERPESLAQSKMIRELCDESSVIYMEHESGHNIPRDSVMSQAIAKALRAVMENSRWRQRKALC
jgi:predicted esterase